MQFGIIGSGSWATALAKILTDSGNAINWWIRNKDTIEHMQKRHHNPHYLNSAYFDTNLLTLNDNIKEVVKASDVVLMVVPAAYIVEAIQGLSETDLKNKKIISAIKGIIPETNQLLNEYLADKFNVNIDNYYVVSGPCHAEEVAAEKLSYLTFSGTDEKITKQIASHFNNAYLNTVTNTDVWGVQYAAVLKNIYALGAGIAHGLEYGDNFLSVYTTNAANEMSVFLKDVINKGIGEAFEHNYNASAYFGDLLVTCYSLHSRNRMFGNMIGKGYSVKAAQLELNMVAEGYNASKCINITNEKINAEIPIATAIYNILWKHLPASEGFGNIEKVLV